MSSSGVRSFLFGDGSPALSSLSYEEYMENIYKHVQMNDLQTNKNSAIKKYNGLWKIHT